MSAITLPKKPEPPGHWETTLDAPRKPTILWENSMALCQFQSPLGEFSGKARPRTDWGTDPDPVLGQNLEGTKDTKVWSKIAGLSCLCSRPGLPVLAAAGWKGVGADQAAGPTHQQAHPRPPVRQGPQCLWAMSKCPSAFRPSIPLVKPLRSGKLELWFKNIISNPLLHYKDFIPHPHPGHTVFACNYSKEGDILTTVS